MNQADAEALVSESIEWSLKNPLSDEVYHGTICPALASIDADTVNMCPELSGMEYYLLLALGTNRAFRLGYYMRAMEDGGQP